MTPCDTLFRNIAKWLPYILCDRDSVRRFSSLNVGVARVDLYVNSTLVTSDVSAPYGFAWDSTRVSDGRVNLVAYAYDAAGNYTASSAVSVTVENTVDATAPVVTITSPSGGATVSGTVTIAANGADNIAVTNMSVSIDGVVRVTSLSGTISYKWNTGKVAKGTHSIIVTATDLPLRTQPET